MVRVDHGPEVDRPGPHAAGDLVELAPEPAVLGAGTPLSHIGPGHSSSCSASTGCTTDRRCPTLALGTRCAFRRRKLTRQAAAGIRPLWPAQDGRITARSPWVFAAPPMIQSVCASRSVLGGRLASTGVEDAALSSKPTVELRASVRRHRRAQGGSPMLRSITPKRARRPSDASVDLLGGHPLGEGLDLIRLGDRRVLAKLAAQIAAQGQTAVAARGGRSGGVRAAVATRPE